VAVGGAVAIGLSACSGDSAAQRVADKAGGHSPTVTLTLATGEVRGRPDTPTVDYFINRLTTLTKGSIKVDPTWGVQENTTDFEQSVAKQVRSGEMDLGWVGSRAFDTLGVTTLQAVQAPFLITSNQLVAKVAADPVAGRMLAGLRAGGLVGLGLYPDQLRHPVGFRKPLASLADFKGARARTPTSNVSDAVLRSLGAEPIHLKGSAYGVAVNDGTLDGVDASLGLAPALGGSILTGNVVFYPLMNVLFTTDRALARLDGTQRSALRRAAADTLRHAVETMPRTEDATPFCAGHGQIVSASPAEVARMEKATQRVYAELEADGQTKAFIEAIRRLKQQVAPVSPPASCGVPAPKRPPTGEAIVPDGVYTAVATKADALRLGVSDECALKADGMHLRLELKHGTFAQWEKCSIYADQIGSQGTFSVTADTFTTRETCCGESYFAWSYDGHYLTLKFRALESGGPVSNDGRLVMDHRWAKVG
jgi:TRAP-type C4-dicarboxylate transport system substrate-binding protein